MTDTQRQHAQQILQEVTALPVRPFSTFAFGLKQDPQCLSVLLTSECGDVLRQVRAALPDGLVAFRGTNNEELVVGAGDDQFDIVRLARTEAATHQLSTEQIIAKLKEYDALACIEINAAETDRVEFNLLKQPEDVRAMATDIYGFCLDCVDQALGGVEDLQRQMEESGFVQLWWD